MGKFIVFVFVSGIIGIAMIGAYYMGTQSIVPKAAEPSLPGVVPSIIPIKHDVPATDSSKISTESGELILSKKTVYAGALLYQLYSIDVLPGWSEKRGASDEATDMLTLTKGDYELTINQTNTGGGLCSFPDNLAPEAPLSNQYSEDSYIELTGFSGEEYRRVLNDEESTTTKNVYNICDKRREQYQQPIRYGHITYKTPTEPDDTLLENMDLMVISVKDRR